MLRRKPSRSARKNSGGTTLSEMLAKRSNPRKKKKRRNASAASSGLSLRSALRQSRKNSAASSGLSLRDALRSSRSNPDDAESIYTQRATDAIRRLENAQDKAQSGLVRDLKALARAQKAVDKILAQGGASRNRIKKALAALEGKSTKKRKTTRKKRKTSSKKSKKRTNPMTTARTNPKRKKRRSPSVSTAVVSLMKKNANYRKTPASKKKKFEAEFKKNYRKLKKSKVSVAQAAARASFAAARTLEVGPVSKRRNPTACAVRSNPKRKTTKRKTTKRKTTKRRKTSSTKRRKTPTRARAKRFTKGMSRSKKRVLQQYGPYTVTFMVNGKPVTIRASKSSSDYKSAKRKGLTGIYKRLKGKKNTPTSLNLLSVAKVHGGDRPTKTQYRKALNMWAGAIDGGHIRGVSKRMVSRSKVRRNPKALSRRTHRIMAKNPAPLGMLSVHRSNEGEAWKTYAMGAASGALGLYSTAYVSGVLNASLKVNADKKDWTYYASELLVPVGLSFATYYTRNQGQAFINVASALAGSAIATVARMTQGSWAKYLGLDAVSKLGGDTRTFKAIETEKAKAKADKAKAEETLEKTTDTTDTTGRYLVNNQFGRYVKVPTTGRYIKTTPSTGRYVKTTPSTGLYRRPAPMGGVHRRPAPHTVGDFLRRTAPMRANPVGADVDYAPVDSQAYNGRFDISPDYDFNVNARNTLKEDLHLYEPLTPAELQAEGLSHVSSNGGQYKVIRATPDVARQVAEANFGSLVGPSQVVRGAVLVLASIYDAPQNMALTDKLRLDRAPNLPKAASFARGGGVFSNGIFNSLFPSIDSQSTYQEFGVKP